jgi:hypothetical protein
MDVDDDNQCGPRGFRTTGQLIPLAGTTVRVPLNMGPATCGDFNPEYEPNWFADDGFFPDEDADSDDFGAAYERSFQLRHDFSESVRQAVSSHFFERTALCFGRSQSSL